jgi:hypothetical protein
MPDTPRIPALESGIYTKKQGFFCYQTTPVAPH